jgi:hypothetical protein
MAIRGFIALNIDVFFEEVRPTEDSTELIRTFEEKLQTLDREARVLQDRLGIFGLMARY